MLLILFVKTKVIWGFAITSTCLNLTLERSLVIDIPMSQGVHKSRTDPPSTLEPLNIFLEILEFARDFPQK